MYKVQKLLVNYKTLEEFKKFKEYGVQELSMLEDLQENIIDNDSESPFYGVYYGDKLVARMSLYRIDGTYDRYFDPPQDYLELWKLEVLPDYHKKGFGSALVNYAKTFNLPIKTNARQRSSQFWEKMGFSSVTYNPGRDRGENPYVWYPAGVAEQELTEKEDGPIKETDVSSTEL
ncbi:N-acetyltransferase [Pseudalkalibacillus salsuginis]|uniref:N-acetyltransferase n=1 Tax=Pseudalkalibacillus salsuginis TaxID=2910972 RepID=UPI001EFF8377|nr:N-acetyltransferase [Pseudalkalibacillus salsuginis]MCF6410455.1 N-acetyltransferase [Pseudalkalibacillus salsuginis]